MKSNRDVAFRWLRKAQSDLDNAQLCVTAGRSLDTACFHCQQAAEKSLKAYLIANERQFPFVDDLLKLLDRCAQVDSAFKTLSETAAGLNPFAVAMRYDEEFWPDAFTVETALEAAKSIHQFVVDRLPSEPTA